ncbi:MULTISPECIES: hypothetical protein [unclassified Dysgonomonas]|uniref:hypothetical protein n=1 Tax=unclassified Dysgonomonas TaxID=2630389 RepID=UPI0025B91A77|nr:MULTISPECIES: hypothetical protein [unclassified Dysgonomonas]HMM05035.1 hypothetical protein [Dysgonomonas sp.]
MIRYILFLFISVVFITPMNAQSNNVLFMKPQVTLQAPNISSLGNFGNFPIGHYSGTTNLSIPFYEIDLDGLKIPIELRYNSSGIKIEQESSWVGLGWSLQIGGTISKEVRGWNDFGGNIIDYNKYPDYFFGKNPDPDPGYYFNDSYDFPPRNSNDEIVRTYASNNSNEVAILNKLSNIDTQPDMFHFNFCSYSGTMYFDRKTKMGNLYAKPIVKNPKDYLDISYDIKNSKWTITDSYGYKFYFSSTERTEVHDISFPYPSGPNPPYPVTYDKKNIPSRIKMPVVTTSWYIDSIVSPKGNKVTFHYDTELFSTPVMFTEVLLMKTTCTARNLNYNYSYSVHEQNILKKIEFNGGSILFSTSARKDIDNVHYPNSELSRGHTGIDSQKLDDLEIRNTGSVTVKKFKFGYSYMGDTNDYNSCRLVLNTVTEESGNTKLNPYEFTYIQGILPKKNSIETDLWGYYNGPLKRVAGGYFTIPTFVEATDNKKLEVRGGKYAIPDFNYARIGTLSEVRYPTGGISEFVYESPVVNTQYAYYSEYRGNVASFRHIPYANPADLNILTFSSTFTLTEEAYVQINTSYYYFENILSGNYPDNYVSLWLRRVLPDGKKETVIDSKDIGFRLFGKTGEKKSELYLLDAGTYELAGQKEPYLVNKYHFFVDASSQSVKRTPCNLGGGLRIKEIHSYDKGSLISKKKFSYETGTLLADAEYLNLMRFGNTPLPTVCSPNTSGYVSFDVSVNGKASSNIGYRYVEETTEDSAGQTTGKTVYRYHVEQSGKISSMPGFPYEPDLRNGTLYETGIYDNKGSMVKKIERIYSIKPGQTEKLTEALFMYYGPHDIPPGSKFYDLKSERWVLDSEITTDYLNGNGILKSSTKYTYDPVYWTLTKTEMSDSKNEKLEELSKYPFNFTDPMSVKMINRNMVGAPVEKVALRNNLVVSGNKAIYYDSLGMCLPKVIQKLNIAKPESLTSYSQFFEEEFRFDRYDNKGNVVQITDKDNVPTVYLWSYSGQYPITEIRNATFTEVEAAVKTVFSVANTDALSAQLTPNETKLKDGSLQKALPNALVTTYTYRPLVGMLTSTDSSGITTYYDYDAFGRLKETYIYKDNIIAPANKQAVQKYEYHYQNQ